MAQMGSRSSRRTEVSPPRDSAARSQRSGYALLAVSGVVLVTAFAGLASFIAPGDSARASIPSGPNSSSGAQLIPGEAAPGQAPVTVDGVALPEGSRTAVVTTNPDGTQVVTLLPPEGSGEKPIVLPPGTPLPPGTVVPPGTTLPPDTTSPPRDDTTPTKPPTSSTTTRPTTPTDPTDPTSPTTGPTTSTGTSTGTPSSPTTSTPSSGSSSSSGNTGSSTPSSH